MITSSQSSVRLLGLMPVGSLATPQTVRFGQMGGGSGADAGGQGSPRALGSGGLRFSSWHPEKGLLPRPLPQRVRTKRSDAPTWQAPGNPPCTHPHYTAVPWCWWPPPCPQELTALLLGHKHQGNAGSCLRTACYHLRCRTEKIKQVTPSPGAGRGGGGWVANDYYFSLCP